VVIVIIGMLVALVVPAVISARESARRASCLNRMDQLSKAILQYEGNKGHLPGYVNQFGGGSLGGNSVASNNNLSWVVLLFENIGRADLWKEWRVNKPDRPVVALSETVCPSDLDKRNVAGALSYVVNCGISDYNLEDGSADVQTYRNHIQTVTSAMGVSNFDPYKKNHWGLFFCNDSNISGSPPVTISLDQISDGAQQTIMLSENLNATSWTGSSTVRQTDVGIVWWSSTPSWTGVPTEVEINAVSSGRYRARPSSHHPGGVNAVFADGHAEFISDRVDYVEFCRKMISNDAEAKKYGLLSF